MNSKELLNMLEQQPLMTDDGSSFLSPDLEVCNLLDLANLVKAILGDSAYQALADYVTVGKKPDPVIEVQLKAFLSKRKDYVSQEILSGLVEIGNVGNSP